MSIIVFDVSADIPSKVPWMPMAGLVSNTT
jgi:hypothetical protein